MIKYVLIGFFALVFNVLPVRSQAPLDSGKIVVRLVFMTDTLQLHFDSKAIWAQACHDLDFSIADFPWFLTPEIGIVPTVHVTLYEWIPRWGFPYTLFGFWKRYGPIACELECIAHEINTLWYGDKIASR
ncbi:MAG: hypothetical protein ACK5RV_07055 [Flavobacterium sp.]|uniref:hypothetical protein n=1 Tax=Flavobacterium sp. TaxID=239 RepID=UPI0022BCD237|nr:hypothetical protein [Flavobacterium sp.]MCZ8297852.1 hypothetical protein [Flavobacterium sp.]